MRRLTDEEWPDLPPEEGTFFRGFIAGTLMSWPFWLLLYLLWRWFW